MSHLPSASLCLLPAKRLRISCQNRHVTHDLHVRSRLSWTVINELQGCRQECNNPAVGWIHSQPGRITALIIPEQVSMERHTSPSAPTDPDIIQRRHTTPACLKGRPFSHPRWSKHRMETLAGVHQSYKHQGCFSALKWKTWKSLGGLWSSITLWVFLF